ncbi:MAG: hypothetical protein R6T93_14570 [Trueperaceae bacterium]
MASPLLRFLVTVFVERPAHRAGAERLSERLEASMARLGARYAAAADEAKAAETLRHVIGIERWGQRRLKVALGEAAYERDEHHGYKPPDDLPLDALVDELRVTRAETVALGRRVAAEGRSGVAVEHNGIGPLSAAGWLRYLRQHGDLESWRVRTR